MRTLVASVVLVFGVCGLWLRAEEPQSGLKAAPDLSSAAADSRSPCDYRFESESLYVTKAHSGNFRMWYSAKLACSRRDPGYEQYLVEDGAIQLATEPKNRLIENCCGPDPKDEMDKKGYVFDGRIYFPFNLAFSTNDTGKERRGIIYWKDPARRRIEIRQAP